MPIKLKSSDGEVFDVDIEVAKASVTIKTMLEDLGVGENNDEIVPLPNVNSTILKKGKCRSMSSGCACVRSIWRSVIGPADIRSTWSPFCVFGVRFVRQSAENSIVLVSLDHPNSPTLFSPRSPAVGQLPQERPSDCRGEYSEPSCTRCAYLASQSASLDALCL